MEVLRRTGRNSRSFDATGRKRKRTPFLSGDGNAEPLLRRKTLRPGGLFGRRPFRATLLWEESAGRGRGGGGRRLPRSFLAVALGGSLSY